MKELGPNDMGKLLTSVQADDVNHMVRIVFGVSVSWVSLPPDQARKLADALYQMAGLVDLKRPPES